MWARNWREGVHYHECAPWLWITSRSLYSLDVLWILFLWKTKYELVKWNLLIMWARRQMTFIAKIFIGRAVWKCIHVNLCLMLEFRIHIVTVMLKLTKLFYLCTTCSTIFLVLCSVTSCFTFTVGHHVTEYANTLWARNAPSLTFAWIWILAQKCYVHVVYFLYNTEYIKKLEKTQ